MKPVVFREQNTVFAKSQEEYLDLPAFITAEGSVTSCWELTPEELAVVKRTGKIYLTVWTFGGPLQPQLLHIQPPRVD